VFNSQGARAPVLSEWLTGNLGTGVSVANHLKNLYVQSANEKLPSFFISFRGRQ